MNQSDTRILEHLTMSPASFRCADFVILPPRWYHFAKGCQRASMFVESFTIVCAGKYCTFRCLSFCGHGSSLKAFERADLDDFGTAKNYYCTVLVYIWYTPLDFICLSRRLRISLLPRSGLREHRQLLQDLGTADEQGLVLQGCSYELELVVYRGLFTSCSVV